MTRPKTMIGFARGLALVALLWPSMALAQAPMAAPAAQQPQAPPGDHSAHGAQAAPVSPAAMGADDCMTAQSKVAVTATTARLRLEAARQTNEPAQLRAAVDEALIALGAVLSATEPCRTAPAMSGMDHSNMAMPEAAPPSAAPASAPDPHAGMAMPATPAATAPARRGAAPVAKPADPHAGMAMPPAAPATSATTPSLTAAAPKAIDCGDAVDPETAPNATYKGKTYYFCSAAERLRFLLNPETYLKDKGGDWP